MLQAPQGSTCLHIIHLVQGPEGCMQVHVHIYGHMCARSHVPWTLNPSWPPCHFWLSGKFQEEMAITSGGISFLDLIPHGWRPYPASLSFTATFFLGRQGRLWQLGRTNSDSLPSLDENMNKITGTQPRCLHS